MRIDDEIRDNSIGSERHVLLVNKATNDTLLSVTAGEFVTKFRDLFSSQRNAAKKTRIERLGDKHIVDPAGLSVSDHHRGLTAFLSLQEVTM